MIKAIAYTLVFCSLLLAATASAQRKDSAQAVPVETLRKSAGTLTMSKKTDSIIRRFSPKTAATRSALLPGLGQIYNKKYWKLPLVYGALGITGGIFFSNIQGYRDTRFAYNAKFKAAQPGATLADSADLPLIKTIYRRLDLQSLRFYRDDYRKNIDYSVLFFLIFWGLNVVDATVDAHLKAFDVSPDLSFHIRLGKSQLAGTSGASLVLAFK